MRFTLNIEAGGAAFADDETGEVDAYSASRELARILRTAADEVSAGRLLDAVDAPQGEGRWLRDENGNKVGTYELSATEAGSTSLGFLALAVMVTVPVGMVLYMVAGLLGTAFGHGVV